jgi:uncharacterized protein (DUF2336 family)
MKNDSADIQKDTMGKVLDQYGEDERVNETMAQRAQLPLKVTERPVNLFSEQVRDHLVTHHELSSDTVMDLFFNARERTTANLIMKVQKRKWILVILLNSFTVMVV